MLLVNGKPHGFTRLSLDLPTRGLPMAVPRERPNTTEPSVIIEIWRKAEKGVYEAVQWFRERNHQVWRVSNRTAQLDNRPVSTKELIALYRAQRGAEKWQKS